MADAIERWFERGVTDGLPVVPPTRSAWSRPCATTRRARESLVAEIPPDFGRGTVEKLAVNAVMAGCRPEYFPTVLAVIEAACDPAFNLHGQSGTTNATSPLIIVNGPARARLGINCAAGVFGPGYRANATIGRALRLVMINLGGTRAGEISMSTLGHPGRYTYCIGEYEEASPWEPLHVERGFAPEQSTVTVFSGEGPFIVNDDLSRSAPQLLASLGWSAAGVWNHKSFPLYGHTLWVIGPEHAKTIGDEGWDKGRVKRSSTRRSGAPCASWPRGPTGPRAGQLGAWWGVPSRTTSSRSFLPREEIVVVVAGGTAGRFSAVIPGWIEQGGRSARARSRGRSSRSAPVERGPPQPLGGERHVQMRDPVGGERVDRRVDQRGRDRDAAGLAQALGPERVAGRRGVHLLDRRAPGCPPRAGSRSP